MPAKPKAKTTKKAATIKVADPAAKRRSVAVRVITLKERLEYVRAFGREIRKSRASELAFLRRAGIIDACRRLARPFSS